MATSASYSLKVLSTGHPTGDLLVDPGVQAIPNSIGERRRTTLSAGNNTITVPTGAKTCVILPPAGNIVAITLKGVNADTGFGLFETLPTVLTFTINGVTSFVLNAGGTVTVELSFF